MEKDLLKMLDSPDKNDVNLAIDIIINNWKDINRIQFYRGITKSKWRKNRRGGDSNHIFLERKDTKAIILFNRGQAFRIQYA